MKTTEISYELKAAFCIWLMLLLGYLIYSPGIAPGFLFDDFVNLDDLGKVGQIDTWEKVLQYMLLADAGPTGRPISVVSFLINDNSWPSVATPFKYTNILLHLICGALLCWLLYLIGTAVNMKKQTIVIIAIVGATLWLFHPLHVSTVLYPVQRMTILAAMFVLLGLVFYVKGRLSLANEAKPAKSFAYMILGLGFCTLLAVLSKENGGLLPILALILDITVLARMRVPFWQRTNLKIFKTVFMILPIICMIIYFAIIWQDKILMSYAFRREFSLQERLLTEGRVILDYIGKILIPRMQTSGLYNDNYTISTGLFNPHETFISLLGVLVLVIGGILLRRKYPFLSLAILFYFTAHIIESTFIPLEIYFEHRNYLPSIFIFFAILIGVFEVIRKFNKNYKNEFKLQMAVSLVLTLTLGSLTAARASLWSDLDKLSLVWAAENPGSVRSQQQAALIWMNLGIRSKAQKHIEIGIKHNPDKLMLHLQLLALHCHGELKHEKLKTIEAVASKNILDEYSGNTLQSIIYRKKDGECPSVDNKFIEEILNHAINNADKMGYKARKQHAYYLLGQSYIYQDRFDEAKNAFVKAYKTMPESVEAGLQMTAILASNMQYKYAMELLDIVDNKSPSESKDITKRDMLFRIRGFDSEIERVRKQIMQDMVNTDN